MAARCRSFHPELSSSSLEAIPRRKERVGRDLGVHTTIGSRKRSPVRDFGVWSQGVLSDLSFVDMNFTITSDDLYVDQQRSAVFQSPIPEFPDRSQLGSGCTSNREMCPGSYDIQYSVYGVCSMPEKSRLVADFRFSTSKDECRATQRPGGPKRCNSSWYLINFVRLRLQVMASRMFATIPDKAPVQ
ncbi:hypothetical protein BDV59DRAFT_65120 [Aspergillus ambiguus]|uniref:uncharacterized protein n=1 Tax=Aspergillus ambiguus TaxID=176160 RepID=UPI003CCDDEEC